MNPDFFERFTDIMNEDYENSTAKQMLILLRSVL